MSVCRPSANLCYAWNRNRKPAERTTGRKTQVTIDQGGDDAHFLMTSPVVDGVTTPVINGSITEYSGIIAGYPLSTSVGKPRESVELTGSGSCRRGHPCTLHVSGVWRTACQRLCNGLVTRKPQILQPPTTVVKYTHIKGTLYHLQLIFVHLSRNFWIFFFVTVQTELIKNVLVVIWECLLYSHRTKSC